MRHISLIRECDKWREQERRPTSASRWHSAGGGPGRSHSIARSQGKTLSVNLMLLLLTTFLLPGSFAAATDDIMTPGEVQSGSLLLRSASGGGS